MAAPFTVGAAPARPAEGPSKNSKYTPTVTALTRGLLRCGSRTPDSPPTPYAGRISGGPMSKTTTVCTAHVAGSFTPPPTPVAKYGHACEERKPLVFVRRSPRDSDRP